MAEWLESFNHLPLIAVVWLPPGIGILSCETASLRNVGGSTQVTARAWNNTRMMYLSATKAEKSPYNLNRVGAT